jgi:hypothetical protein
VTTEHWPKCGTSEGMDLMPGTTKAGKPRKRNNFPAPCSACNTRLAPGAGVIELSDGKWVAFCAEPEIGR